MTHTDLSDLAFMAEARDDWEYAEQCHRKAAQATSAPVVQGVHFARADHAHQRGVEKRLRKALDIALSALAKHGDTDALRAIEQEVEG